MRKFRVKKLVRDKVIEGITSVGNKPKWKVLSNEEFVQELKRKIFEEAKEIPQADNKELVKELADLQEIIDNLLGVLKISKLEFNNVQRKKINEAGAFKKRYYIDTVEIREDSAWLKYYLDKFKEVKK